MSPLQALLDLALPPNRGLPSSVVRVDLDGLRRAGFEIPKATRVSSAVSDWENGVPVRTYTMPGGGFEMYFPYPIPAEYLKVIR